LSDIKDGQNVKTQEAGFGLALAFILRGDGGDGGDGGERMERRGERRKEERKKDCPEQSVIDLTQTLGYTSDVTHAKPI
jgi:hypothetical protein